jgi:hypothetical protein
MKYTRIYKISTSLIIIESVTSSQKITSKNYQLPIRPKTPGNCMILLKKNVITSTSLRRVNMIFRIWMTKFRTFLNLQRIIYMGIVILYYCNNRNRIRVFLTRVRANLGPGWKRRKKCCYIIIRSTRVFKNNYK